MKLTNNQLLSSTKTLSILSQKDLPIKISFSIARNIKKIEDELKVYNAEREKLLNKYGEKDEKDKLIVDDKNQIKFKKGKLDEFNKDFLELLTIENEIDIIKFAIDKIEDVNISPSSIMSIEYMIED